MHAPQFILLGVLSQSSTTGDTEKAPAPPAEAKPQRNASGSATGELEQLLQQEDSIAPVSRVMGYRIVQSAVKPYIHGTLVADWRWRDGTSPLPSTFSLREAHLYAGAHILDIAQPELFLQFEQRSKTDPPVSLRYAQVDLRAYKDLLVFRVGMFLIPFGVYNTDLFLRYVAKLPERPEVHGRLVPTAWREIGVQAKGRWELSNGRALSYAFYVTNGLSFSEGTAPSSSNPSIPFTTALLAAKGGKSLGGRVAYEPWEGFSVGLSGYDGAIDGAMGEYQLVGIDAIFRYGRFSFDGEALTGEETETGPAAVTKRGYYAAAGYKVTDWFEPVVSTERVIALPDYRSTDLWGGFNLYPYPESFPTLVLKGAYGHRAVAAGAPSNRVTLQLVIGY